MRHEHLHERRSPHRSVDYLITVSYGGVLKQSVWDGKKAFPLDHPHGWTLKKVNGQIVISDLSETDVRDRGLKALLLDMNEANKQTFDIEPNKLRTRTKSLRLTIEPLKGLQPAYKQISYAQLEHKSLPKQILMYQGVRHFLLKYRPVGRKMTASAGTDSIFSYERTPAGYTVTAHSNDVKIKSRGRKAVLPIGMPYTMIEEEFFNASIIYGINWWRFRVVATPDALPPIEDEQSQDDLRESFRLKRATQGTVALLVLIFASIVTLNKLFPTPVVVSTAKINLKAPKVIPHQEIAEVKPLPLPPPPPPPPPEKKKEIVKEKPKPLEKKLEKKPEKKIVQKEKPAPKKAIPKPTKVAEKPAPLPPTKSIAPPPKQVAEVKPPPEVAEKAQLMKSLGFLSTSSKATKTVSSANYDKSAPVGKPPTLKALTNEKNALNKMSEASTETEIETRSARNIASNAGVGSKIKGLNDVQGKVNMSEIYDPKAKGRMGTSSSLSVSGPGDISEAEIEKALSKFLAKFQFCYEKSLLSDAGLAGDIRLQWDINPSGGVTSAKVISSQMKNDELQGCILGVLKKVPFSSPKGGSVTAKKTLSFQSSTL